ncbi:transcriptional regulator [Nocardia neocaledoniensis NBRC 108232]|uniref:GntR family transcriptional regulator n=1 Tax=Nocardia neocaledoniensis TaxID=236511 RepID=A0A317P1X4_9NOCA|nr:GntR family transcriptional regulator [Nocardia neocaledoniensis]PWV81032.1 GntR family transcriptional regulator [Nocardia neocaledoniensis]GEM32962.1 transcriptional regulator [Nocardia neocaledoniensis NBRC 108232]
MSSTVRRMTPQQVCRAIRDDIIRGDFVSGQRLTEDTLAERYGVSRVPVREALRTLEAEGFASSRPYAGTFVAELTEAEAADLLEIRALLEPLCASRAATRRSPEQLGRLKELTSLGQEAVRDGRLDELARLNSRFHEVLAEASGSALLTQLITQLSWKIAWVYAVELPRRAEDSWHEHEQICAALAAGDAERARAVVAEHIAHAESAYRLRGRSTDA